MTDRVQKLRDKYFASRPCITAERLVLQTEAYKLFAGEAAPIFRAKVVNYIMEHMTTLIMDNELVVGTPTNKYRGANLHPEFQSAEKFYIPDIDEFPVRKCDPYDVAPEDRELILKTLNEYWLGRSMEDIAGDVLPADIEKARREDIISVGLRNGVSGETTCDHEKLLTVGLRGYIDECRRRIAGTVSRSFEDQAKIDFWNACIIQSEALITYAHRMADEAERQAAVCEDELRRAELQRNAKNVLEFLLETHAMKRLMGIDDETEIINRPADGEIDSTNVEYFKVGEDTTIDLSKVCTDKGTSYAFVLDMEKLGFYRATITASSEQSELAQIPVSLFALGIPIGTMTWNGTNGEPVSMSREFPIFSRFEALRLYFAQSGIKLHSIRMEYLGEQKP